ncbi:MAG: c-type cytochrome [Pseudomonadales bacterium]|nr:c-type cytochrome [Pseudomonadales bacterium]
MSVENKVRRIVASLFVGLLAVWGQAALEDNAYDAASGSLMVPVIDIGSETSYSAIFSLVSEQPLIWGADEFTEITKDSRTAAIYDGENGTLWIPEIFVLGSLYSLNFTISTTCGFAVCIEPDVSSLQEDGRAGSAVFTTALSSSSTFTCSTCHAISETDGFAVDGLKRPGHSLMNVTKRESYKNGQHDDLRDAVNTCVTEWMNTAALQETDTDWINLLNWFEDQSTADTAELISIDIVDPPVDLSGGDSQNGRELFNTRCLVCHGLDGEGTPLAPQITETGLTPEYIVSRTRTSGLVDSPTYSGLTGGIMPFWGSNRLTDEELIDIAQYVSEGAEEILEMGGDDPGNLGETGCTSDHPKVGQTAVFQPGFHDVSGTARIIDDCTIDLENFTFDGGGIDVRVYVGNAGFFDETEGGFAISDDLVGIAFSGGVLRVTLPAGRTLDDFDSISIWCVAVGISFGTGFFE